MVSKYRSHLDLPVDRQNRYNAELEGIHSAFRDKQIPSVEREQRISDLREKYSLPPVTLSGQFAKSDQSTTKNYHSAVFPESYDAGIIAGEDIYQGLNKTFHLSGSPRILFIKNINKHRYSGNTLPYNGTLMLITGMSSRIDGPGWDGYNTSCVSILPENITADDIYRAFKEIKEIVKKPNTGRPKLTIGAPLRDGSVPNKPFLDFFNEDMRKYPIVSLDELKKNNVYGERGNEKGIFPILGNMNMTEETEYLFNDPKITTINWDFIDGSKEIYSDADVTFVFPRRKLPEEKR